MVEWMLIRLTAAGGIYTLWTAPESRSTVWKPLVEA